MTFPPFLLFITWKIAKTLISLVWKRNLVYPVLNPGWLINTCGYQSALLRKTLIKKLCWFSGAMTMNEHDEQAGFRKVNTIWWYTQENVYENWGTWNWGFMKQGFLKFDRMIIFIGIKLDTSLYFMNLEKLFFFHFFIYIQIAICLIIRRHWVINLKLNEAIMFLESCPLVSFLIYGKEPLRMLTKILQMNYWLCSCDTMNLEHTIYYLNKKDLKILPKSKHTFFLNSLIKLGHFLVFCIF